MPYPNITWLKEREPVVFGAKIRQLSEGRQLEIIDAKESDTARYTCVATNTAGQTKKDFDLNVLGEWLNCEKN